MTGRSLFQEPGRCSAANIYRGRMGHSKIGICRRRHSGQDAYEAGPGHRTTTILKHILNNHKHFQLYSAV